MLDKQALHERIADNTEIHEQGCWLWTLALNDSGYGTMRIKGKLERAHRVSWEVYVGPIPEGVWIDHLCRIRDCVNPEHLEPVTPGLNISRGLRGYSLNGTCRSGAHSVTSLDDVYVINGSSTCRKCKIEREGRYYRRKRSQ